MTYLQLINNVLTRLREDTITAAQVDTDPYWRFIGSAVNDAKDRVEDAWQWSALRGTDLIPLDTPTTTPPITGSAFELPNSADNHYIIKGFYGSDSGTASYYELTQVSKDLMIQRYAAGDSTPSGKPREVAVTKRDSATGNIQVVVFPEQLAGTTAEMYVDRVNHQESLVAPDDVLLVPSLPVYTLATALASRERGEVGGTPTSELFTIADRHLSDAIATDSALFSTETVWYDIEFVNQTNVRTA